MICRDGFSVLSISAARAGLSAGWCHSEGRFGRIGAQIEVDERLCRAHHRDQRADADDVHDALEIVGQHVQRHFGADPFQRPHLEVG